MRPSAPARPVDRRPLWLAGLGAAQAALYVAATALAPTDAPMRAVVPALAAFVLYVVTLRVARGSVGAAALPIAIGFALVYRAILLPEPPFLSDDHYRYLWDGLVQLDGINPYRHAPADPALAGIDDALRARVNHPHVHTIYPPLAQVAFLLGAALPGGWLALKLIWLACDLAIAALLHGAVPRSRRPQAWIVYGWSPLVLVEVAWNAHLDPLGILFLVIALRLAARSADAAARARGRAAAIGLALAGAALVKYFAAALVPAAARRRRSLTLAAAFAAAVGLLYLPYSGSAGTLASGLSTFASTWRFNDGLFAVLAALAPSQAAARLIAAGVIALLVFQSVRNEWPLERAAFWIIGALLLLSPTVHPWYLLWMIPLLALRPNPAWLYLSGSVLLAYFGLGAYRATGVWPEPVWVELVIWGPFFLVLVADAWRGSWWRLAVRQAVRGD